MLAGVTAALDDFLLDPMPDVVLGASPGSGGEPGLLSGGRLSDQ